ncbi:MAG: DUF3515 family protein [Microbacteriaceae bacterium]|nr:DUF3515 family protein [Microbacteriaceae bacterium]
MRNFRPLLALPLVLLGLAGCTPIVPLDPAPDANNPKCADVIVRLPDVILDADKQDSGSDPAGEWLKRETDAQATGAWGNPTSILLRCGVAVPGPSTLPCATVKGIDWLRDDSGAPNYVFTTFGRDPAVEVVIDSSRASGTNVLEALSLAVGTIPTTGACTNPIDVLDLPSPEPSPSPTG